MEQIQEFENEARNDLIEGRNAVIEALRARTDAYRPEKGFCDGVKGLNLCGCKVVQPDGVYIHTITA